MPTLSFPTWRDVPEKAWRWPSFSPAEIACRGTGAIKINTEAMDKLQALRDRLGKPLIVRSAYRSPEHNLSIGVVTGPLIGLEKDPLLLVVTVSARRPGALHLAQGRRARFCYLSRL